MHISALGLAIAVSLGGSLIACSSSDDSTTDGSSNSSAAGANGAEAPRSYQGTAAVGDFMIVVIDPAAQTINYDNRSNGQSGTVPYSVAVDGSYDVADPDGNILRAIELPGYALVMDLDHAGPERDTRSLAFGIEKAPISLESLGLDAGIMMQFRVNSGGMQVGNVSFGSDGTVSTSEYWPFGALNDQGSAFRSDQHALTSIVQDPSGDFLVVDEPGDASSYVFATPSGITAIDNPNGNMIIFDQPASPAFDGSWGGDYAALVYGRANAGRGGTAPDGGAAPEEGVPEIHKRNVSVGSDGSLVVSDEAGNAIVSGTLVPVDNVLVGPGMLTGACNGLFMFSVMDASQPRDVFAAFIDRALLVASFRPNGDGSYGYFYGAGLRP